MPALVSAPHLGVLTVHTPTSGGGAQYTAMLLHALARPPATFRNSAVTFFGARRALVEAEVLGAEGWAFAPVPAKPFDVRAWLRRSIPHGPMRRRARALYADLRRRSGAQPDLTTVRTNRAAERVFQARGLDLLICPMPLEMAVETSTPTLMAIHDVQPRLQPHFPEFDDGYWRTTEYICRSAARLRNVTVLADSQIGREDLLDCYSEFGLTEERVAVLPYTVPPYLAPDSASTEAARVRSAYSLPNRFLFYPAVFAPHKNHARIIEALGLLALREELEVPLVLVGSTEGKLFETTHARMMETARRVGVEHQITHLGYVPEDDMTGLFGAATALVMPSFFGPTNVPVVEAWAVGCPVIAARVRGMDVMCEGAAVFVEPGSPESIADGIARVWLDRERGNDDVATLVAEGRRRALARTPARFQEQMWEIIAGTLARGAT
jgi:glycosyltransferase involved in cell wall biosynthesis